MAFLSEEYEKEMFSKIEEKLSEFMDGRIYPEDNASTLGARLKKCFKHYGLRPVYVGVYKRDPAKPMLVYPMSANHDEGSDGMCTNISIMPGSIIGRAIRTGLDQNVPNVHKDPDHHSCDLNMGGSEYVCAAWPKKPYSGGYYRGRIIPVGALDIDLNWKDALSSEGFARIQKIWRKYEPKIFPNEAEFQPIEGLDVTRDPFSSV